MSWRNVRAGECKKPLTTSETSARLLEGFPAKQLRSRVNLYRIISSQEEPGTPIAASRNPPTRMWNWFLALTGMQILVL